MEDHTNQNNHNDCGEEDLTNRSNDNDRGRSDLIINVEKKVLAITWSCEKILSYIQEFIILQGESV